MDSPIVNEAPVVRRPTPLMERIAVVGWVSFVMAAAATMVFFATFDPADLAGVATFPMPVSRLGGYTLGFFGFWLLTALTGAFVCMLLNRPGAAGAGRNERS